MKKIILVVMCAGIFFSCGNRNTEKKTIDDVIADAAHSVEEMFEKREVPRHMDEYMGTYKGSLPCADCEGIDVTLTLKSDHTFVLETVTKSGKEGLADIEDTIQGDYMWTEMEDNIVMLEGIGDRPNKYLMSEGMLIQLDMDGKRIEGPLADKYVLKKVE